MKIISFKIISFSCLFLAAFAVHSQCTPLIESSDSVHLCENTEFFLRSSCSQDVNWKWFSVSSINPLIADSIPNSNNDSLFVSTSMPGEFAFFVTSIDTTNGDIDSSQIVVVFVLENPTISNYAIELCSGSPFTVSPVGSETQVVPTGTLYTWSILNQSNNNVEGDFSQETPLNNISQLLTNSTSAIQTVVYEVIPTNQACLGETFSVQVEVKPKPFLEDILISQCSGFPVSISPSDEVNGLIPAGTLYSWSVISNGQVSGESNHPTFATTIDQLLILQGNASTAQNVNYLITPSFEGCLGDVASLVVTLNPSPSISDYSSFICSGIPFVINPENVINGVVPLNTQYEWTYELNTNVIIETPSNSQNSINGLLTTTSYSNQEVIFTVNPYLGGCLGVSFELTITVLKSPRLVAISDQIVCFGDPIQLFASELYGLQATVYDWTASEYPTSLNFPYTANPIANPPSTTDYVVTMNDPSNSGCVARDSVHVTIVDLPIAEAGNDLQICEGDIVALNANAGGDIIWTPTDGLNSIEVSNPIANPLQSTTYQLMVSDNASGCTNSDLITIYVHPNPIVTLPLLEAICENEIATISVIYQGTSSLVYEWIESPELINNGLPSVNFIPTTPGLSDIAINVEDSFGCHGTAITSIIVHPSPTPIIFGQNVVCGNSTWQEYHANGSDVQYTWQIVAGEVISGEGSNTIWIHWNDEGDASISLMEHDLVSGCEGMSDLEVSFQGEAPDSEPVLLLSSNGSMLYCENPNFTYYKWGYTSINTGLSSYVPSTNQYCDFATIDVVNNYYWVEHGNDLNCLTRSYFNPPAIQTSVMDKTEPLDISVYPNPLNTAELNISLKDINHKAVDMGICDISGRVVMKGKILTGINVINMNGIPSGIYILKIDSGRTTYTTMVVRN